MGVIEFFPESVYSSQFSLPALKFSVALHHVLAQSHTLSSCRSSTEHRIHKVPVFRSYLFTLLAPWGIGKVSIPTFNFR